MFKFVSNTDKLCKSKLIFTFLVLCCLDLLPKCADAQKVSIDYTSKHYTIHDGLAQMQVMSAFKDSRGYLWCNTKGGLSRFDGKKFKNYTSGIYNLRGNDILTFGEDSEGNLLIFSPTKISRLSGDSILQFNFPLNISFYSLNKRSVSGQLLEVKSLNKQNKPVSQVLSCKRLDSMYTLPVKSKYGPIIFFDEENENYIWQANKDSVYLSDLISQKVIKVIPNPGNINSLLKRGSELYAVTNKSEIYLLNQNRFELLVKTGLQSQYLKIIPTPDSTAFIIKTDKDLYFYKDTLVLLKDKMTFIRDILFDDEENLWVATEEGLYNFFQLNFVNYSFSMGNKDWVWSVIEDNKKNIWFASYQNGLWKWDGERVTDYTKTINAQFSECIINKPGQPFFRYYMGASKSDSLLFFPTETNVLQYNGHVFSQVRGLKDGAYQITKSFSDGMFLCAGYPGLFELKQNRISRKWDRDQLQISSILNVERDQHNNLVAIGKGGIALIKKDTTLRLKQKFAMHSYCSATDHKGNIWIAGTENINLLSNDSLKHIAQKKEEAFYSMLLVDPHYLLLGGIKGLYIVNLNHFYQSGIFEMILFNQNSGFTGIECGQNGFFTDSEGFVWIPTSDRVTRFDPQKLIKKKIKPPNLYVNVEWSEDNIQWNHLKQKEAGFLKYKSNNLRFEMDAVSFANIGNIRYYYRLEGLQENWSEASESNEIAFYNLAPGSYRFLAKADPGISEAMSGEIVYDFEIKKPFWLTWWFIVLAALLFVTVVAFIVKFFQKQERKKAAIQQRLLQLRSDALSAQLDPHFVMNCLNNISGLVNAGYKSQANDYIVKFSKLLRVILQSVKKDVISLSAELEMVKKYMDLEKYRCQNCFNYHIYLPPKESPENILVPPMILQPLVENSIKHGFKEMNSGGAQINITIGIKNKKLQFNLKDNGGGIKNTTSGKGTGLGTKITRERIELLQQKNNIRFNIRNTDQGVEVLFEMPLVLKNPQADFKKRDKV